MGNAASAACDTNNGCGDEASLVQLGKVGVVVEKAKLGQLTDGAGMGSAEGRSAMLKYGDDMLRLMTKKYGNAWNSSNIEDSDKEMLVAIIGIINGTMYTSIAVDHGEDQTEIDTARQAVINCNDALDTKEAGDVAAKRTSTEAAREVHKQCRKGGSSASGLLQVGKGTSSEERSSQLPHDSQDEACQAAHDKSLALNQTIVDIPLPPGVPTFPSPRTLEAVTAFFTDENAYVTWFNLHKGTFFQARNESDNATEKCESHKQQCDADQHAFEEEYDLFKQDYEGTCATYDGCFVPQSDLYGVAKTRVEASMVSRKAAFEAGETIIYKIECLLGYHGCDISGIDSSDYDLVFTELPPVQTCDDSEVQYGHCSDEFILHEYAQFQGLATVSEGLNCPSTATTEVPTTAPTAVPTALPTPAPTEAPAPYSLLRGGTYCDQAENGGPAGGHAMGPMVNLGNDASQNAACCCGSCPLVFEGATKCMEATLAYNPSAQFFWVDNGASGSWSGCYTHLLSASISSCEASNDGVHSTINIYQIA